jgi:hypothetical protein
VTLASHTRPLNPYDPTINEVDVALVAFDDQAQADLAVLGVGALTGISSKSLVHQGALVEVVGKESGRRSLYVGGATLTREFDLDGTTYGFKNLFELTRVSRFHGITGTLSAPVAPGDSGAWVLRPGATGTEWLGMVIAGDGPTGTRSPPSSSPTGSPARPRSDPSTSCRAPTSQLLQQRREVSSR